MFVQYLAMKRVLFALIFLPIFALADGGLPNQPYIYVEGKAEIQKPADMVTLTFDLVARAPDQSKANEEVQVKANKIFTLLNVKKVAENDVIAESIRSEPQFQQGDKYSTDRGKLIGYTVTRPFKVKIRDVTAFQKMIDELIAIGGVEFSEVDGGLSKEKEIQDDLSEKALVNARERVEKTLKPIGMKVASVFAVSPVVFPEIEGRMFGGETTLGVRSAEVERAIVTSEPQYRLAPITLNRSVHVIYLISPAK